jgi:glycosyltransferase involved in cell wall biosynthesis
MKAFSVSYILLTYNQRDTVTAAVESALEQDVQPMEIIISDDCSSDGTFAEVEAAVSGYSGPHRVILNRNAKNLGLAGNLAKVHELSTGDIIIAAAGDDISHRHRCQKILETFIEEKPLLVCSYAKVIDPAGKPVSGNFRTALFYREAWDLKQVARSKSLYIGATGAWHRSLYDRYGPIAAGSYEDLVLGFRAALEERVAVIREELVSYRLGFGVTSSDAYQPDIETFKKQRLNSYLALKAVMHQREVDARKFGLTTHSPVMRVLQREQRKADLRIAYYRDTTAAYTAKFWRQPLLMLAITYAERHRARRFVIAQKHCEKTRG